MAHVLNWIVQGTLLTLMVWSGLHLLRSINAATRYVIWWTTLIAVVALWAAPMTAPFQLDLRAVLGGGASDIAAILSSPPRSTIDIRPLPERFALALGVAWILRVAWSTTRLLRALADLCRIKQTSRPIETAREERLVIWQSIRGRGRPVRIALSDRIAVPSLLGLGSALIVLPEKMLDRVSDRELEQIIVHEHAHLRRFDDWALLAQSLIKIWIGFHPAVVWIDRQLSLEREVACDDWVLALTGARKEYAQLLTRLVAQPDPQPSALSPGAARSRPTISTRVARLLDRGRDASVRLTRAVPLSAGAMLLMTPLIAGLTLLSEAEVQPLDPRHASQGHEDTRTQPEVSQGVATEPSSGARLRFARPEFAPAVGSIEPQSPVENVGVREAPAPLGLEPLNATPFAPNVMMSLSDVPASPFDNGRRVPDGRSPQSAPWDIATTSAVAFGDRVTSAARATAASFSRFGTSVAAKF